MNEPDNEDTGPPSDRERREEWRRTLYSKLDAVHSTLKGIQTTLYALFALVAMAVLRHW